MDHPFLQEGQIMRMGMPPVRIEVVTSASGVDFEERHASRVVNDLDEVEVTLLHTGEASK